MRTTITTLFLVALLGACNKVSEVVVVLSSDLVSEVDQLSVKVSSESVTRLERSYALPSEATLPASFELHSSGSPTVSIAVQLFEDAQLVVERRAIMTMVADTAVELRLALDQACAYRPPCPNPDDTCVEGECRSAQVDGTSLPTLTGEPDLAGSLATEPTDLATSSDLALPVPSPDLAHGQLLDLAMPPVDLAPAVDASQPAVDLAPPVDGSICAPKAAPASDPMCNTYVFTKGTLGGLVLTGPSDTTYDFTCGRLHVHVPAGSHVYPNDVRLSAMTGPMHKLYTVSSAFTVAGTGDAAVGPQIYAFKSATQYEAWSALVTRGVLSDAWTLERMAPGSIQPQASGTTTAGGVHTASLSSTNVGTSYYFGPTIDGTTMGGATSFGSTTLPATPMPSFSISNGTSGVGTTNAVDVYVDYIQICGKQ